MTLISEQQARALAQSLTERDLDMCTLFDLDAIAFELGLVSMQDIDAGFFRMRVLELWQRLEYEPQVRWLARASLIALCVHQAFDRVEGKG
jgi:hypothetical protein